MSWALRKKSSEGSYRKGGTKKLQTMSWKNKKQTNSVSNIVSAAYLHIYIYSHQIIYGLCPVLDVLVNSILSRSRKSLILFSLILLFTSS